MIRLFSPAIDDKEIKAAVNTLKSLNWASGSGKDKVQQFETNFKNYLGAGECVAVNSGTAALHLALNVLDVKGKEVLVPSLTFVTTVHSILYNGGIPVFVDVEPDTLCLNIDDLKKKISRKTCAVIPMHYGGYPCKMEKIRKIAQKNSCQIVEDAAHACGSTIGGEKVGTKSEFVCFSFHPVKNLAMPKGGAISINLKNNSKIKDKLKVLRWCGIDDRKKSFYNITALGFNYYMDEISAAIGIEQLKKLDKLNKVRKKIASIYHKGLNFDHKMPLSNDCSYHMYWICVKNRNRFMKKMSSMGIS